MDQLTARVFLYEDGEFPELFDNQGNPFEDFARFLFSLYQERDHENKTSLSKLGTFGARFSTYLERQERARAILTVAIDLEMREVTGWSEEEKAKPRTLEAKSTIHCEAEKRYPHLFAGPYSSDDGHPNKISEMWRDSGQAEIRSHKPWSKS